MEGLTITIKLLVHGKEVGCIIGKNGETMQKLRKELNRLPQQDPFYIKPDVDATASSHQPNDKGETIKKLREEGGAHINISLGWLERIVAIAGRSDSLFHALKIILNMIEKCPTKGVNIQYRPRPTGSHVVFAGGPQTVDPSDVDASAQQAHRDEVNVPNDLTRFLQDPLNPMHSSVGNRLGAGAVCDGWLLAKIKEIRQASGGRNWHFGPGQGVD
nr:poly(rC)-binding protein 2-like isoform X2 [Misgurnus anguillicaudatus]